MLTGFATQTYGDLDHGAFLDVRDVPGGVEATLAEMDGAGAVVWIWSANPAGELVLQIDGKETVYPFASFVAGKWLPKAYPFAFSAAGAGNLFFPILHKHHCRIAVRAKSRRELGALFYQVAWNALASGEEIESFDLNAVQDGKVKLKQLAGLLLHPPAFPLCENFDGLLPSGSSTDVLSVSGSGTIQCLEISARTKKQLSGLHVDIYWDGAAIPAISCPLHMLCGVSPDFENVRSLPASVVGSTATLRWPMPFSKGACIRLENRGGKGVALHVSSSIDQSRSSPRRLYGGFSNHRNLGSDEENILKLAEVFGKGDLVGCVLQVDSRSDGWWGEGDPVIWVDSDEHPAWHGTGTEDYFGFAWCSAKRFQHPFCGQTRSGFVGVSMYRYHILDPLSFNRWIRFDFEAHGSGSGSMDYSTLVLWYSDEGAIPTTP